MTDIKTELIGQVAIVTINRPKKFNSLTWDTFAELKTAIDNLNNQDVRCIILRGEGKHFTAGLDLTSALSMQEIKAASTDPARSAFAFFNIVKPLQDSVSSFENVRVPVIAAIHGYCIGAGVDLASACDIRVCAKDTQFTIKEVDVGLAADIGTLQRFQKVVGNESWARELAYTARFFTAEEALQKGFVSKVCESNDDVMKTAMDLANLIATKSPIAVSTSKRSIVYSRDHSVEQGLNHIALLNSSMLQTDDLMVAASAMMQKSVPHFNKL